jgi:putative endonuclease
MGWLSQARIRCLQGAVLRLDVLAKGRGRTRAIPAHLLTGLEGEDAVYFYLRRKGYTIVARRWSSSTSRGDIDLVAWQGPLLCIVEVKTRTAHDLAPAEVAVDFNKRQMLRQLARHYVRQLPHENAPQVRFDVVSAYLIPGKEKEFVHFENAFGWNENRRD